MRPFVIPLLVGSAAVGTLVFAAALAVVVVADAHGWETFHLSVGPLTLLAFERAADGSSATFGAGLALAGAVGGLLNALAAALLHRHRS